MTLVTADVRAPGGIEGTGPVVIVDHTTDNNLVTFRFKHADVRMSAAEEDFEAAGGSSAPARSSFRTPIARRSSRR